MAKLDWNNFDGTQFQKLCNSLLLFDVSKFAHVYSAPGSDGGVDQLYEGTHDSKTGKWRFQDKFHNSGKKSADIGALKSDIIFDIKNNYTSENFIVFITNINLTVKKFDELVNTAKLLLSELNIVNCEFQLWHDATLEGLISNYPTIYNWFWEKDSIILQPYEEYFSNQLRDDTFDLRNQLKNNFFGRELELLKMTEFIEDPTKSCLAIIANGGYGKTRLCIEFLKSEISKMEDWIPLVMSHAGFNPTNFAHLLKTKRQLLIFIDNAHEIPEIVSEVKRQIDNTHGKDKLIITTRPTLFSEIFAKLPSHGKNMEKLILSKLPYDKTKEMIKREIPWLSDQNIIHLAGLSKGIPNVILEFIRLIRSGKQPSEISIEESFNESVKELISQAIDDVEKRSLISKEKANDFLKLIALISPANNDDVNKKFIEEFLEIRKDKLELLINEFKTLNLLDGGKTLSIRPDPYSDSILTETVRNNKTFIDQVKSFSGAEVYLENILKNLAEAEIPEDEKRSFIDGLLYGYVSLIKAPSTSNQKIKSILEFVEKIVVYKPTIAIYAIKEYQISSENSAHAMHSEVDYWSGKSFYIEFGQTIAKILTVLCTYSKYAKDNKAEVHKLIEQFIEKTQNLDILGSCYTFHEWDFPYFRYHPKKCCERQTYLKDIACQYLLTNEELKLDIALKATKVLLELEFQLERYYEPVTMQMHYGEAKVPYCEHIKKLRTDLIHEIIDFIKITADEKRKDNALGILMDYFFYASKNVSKRFNQDLSQEIDIVLTFIKDFLDNNPSIKEKNKILGFIQRYERVGFRDEFQERIRYLKEKSRSTTSLCDALEMNMINADYFDSRNNLETRIAYLIKQYDSVQGFEKDLIKVRLGLDKGQTQFETILSIVGKIYPQEAREMFSRIQETHPTMIPEAVALIGDQYKDEKYFYGILQWLWEKKKHLHRRIFLANRSRSLSR